MTNCPICDRFVVPGTPRCPACGADLLDPEVRAMAGTARGTLGTDAAPLPEQGSLAIAKFLGATREGLESGAALRKLAAVGAGLLLLAFFLPYHDRLFGAPTPAWKLHQDGFALFYPLIAAVAGLVLAAVPLPVRLRGAGLVLVGLLGAAYPLGRLGAWGFAPTTTATLENLGLLVAGTAVIVRLLAPRAPGSREALVAGAAIVCLGAIVPMDLATQVPGEYLGPWSLSGPPVAIHLKALARHMAPTAFLAMWGLVPMLATPAVAALGWSRQGGVWDKGGLMLRPIAWLVVLAGVISYGLYAFNMLGWQTEGASILLGARLRLVCAAIPFFLWIEYGAAALWLDLVKS